MSSSKYLSIEEAKRLVPHIRRHARRFESDVLADPKIADLLLKYFIEIKFFPSAKRLFLQMDKPSLDTVIKMMKATKVRRDLLIFLKSKKGKGKEREKERVSDGSGILSSHGEDVDVEFESEKLLENFFFELWQRVCSYPLQQRIDVSQYEQHNISSHTSYHHFSALVCSFRLSIFSFTKRAHVFFSGLFLLFLLISFVGHF